MDTASHKEHEHPKEKIYIKVAIVLAYGVFDDPVLGEKIAKLGTAQLSSGAYTGATIRPYHELAPGARGTTMKLDVYLFY